MKVDGRCHCGHVSFEAEIDPEAVGICHCTDCQRLTGTAYRASVRAPAASFVLKTGQPTIYIKTGDSGTKRAHAFCPICGTPVYASAPVAPTTYSLRIGTLEQRAVLPPQRQLWCRSALSWAQDLRALPQLDRQ